MSFANTITERKFEIAIFAMAALLLGGLGSLFKSPKALMGSAEQDIVYEMPRPKNYVSAGFDLNGREIDRDYINPFAKKAKKAEAAKKDDKKTAQAAADAKKKTAVAKKKEAVKNKSQVAVTVVNDKPTSTLSPDSSKGSGAMAAGAYVGQQAAAGADSGTAVTAEDTTKPSSGQWRALLSAQPTSENLSKLIAALVKGDVDQKTYNTIVSDLLSNSKSEVQELGIQAANYSYSVATFSLVANKMDSLTGNTKTKAQTYLMSYTSGSRLNILAAALRSSDSETVITATEIVIQGYAQARDVTVNASSRPGRGETQGSSTANYAQFVPLFKTLAQSDDAAIASLAQTALGQIQTNVASL